MIRHRSKELQNSELESRLKAEQLHQEKTRAPEGFTDSVMAAIRKLPPEKHPVRRQACDDRWKPVCRRLGYSLILTAGVVMFSLLIPASDIQPDSISARLQNSIESTGSGYTDAFTGINRSIMDILNAGSNREQVIKGGSDNGM